MPAVMDLTAYRGDDWSKVLNFTRNGAPYDLSAATVVAWARSERYGIFALDVTLGAEPGSVVLRFPAAGKLPAGGYVYDVEVTDQGEVSTLLTGQLVVVRDVTNELPV